MTVKTLPEGYKTILEIDLQKNKRMALIVNLLSVAIMLVMLILPVLARGVITISLGFDSAVVPLLISLFGVLIYLVLHELVHGIFMRAFSGLRPRYGFTGMYAYAGSDAFFCLSHYLIIAWAPIVLLGALLLILNLVLPGEFFWPVYIIQAINVSGSAGDFYVGVRLLRLPRDLLVLDSGVRMEVYSRQS